MEITKDIIINTENLAKNSDIVINYSGKLYNSKTVFIHYGYTPNSFEYQKTELNNNNSIQLHLSTPGYFYFYFSNENGDLDNNNFKDYQLYIKKSNLILTDNCSMKELSYRYIKTSEEDIKKTFYTRQTIRNTSKPQEIIIPRPFNINNPTSETKNINGYILEPIKEATNYSLSQALIPLENFDLIKQNKTFSFKKINITINKLLLCIPKLFGKNYSKQ